MPTRNTHHKKNPSAKQRRVAAVFDATTVEKLLPKFASKTANWSDLNSLYLALLEAGEAKRAASTVLELAPHLDVKDEGLVALCRSLFRNKAFEELDLLTQSLKLAEISDEVVLGIFVRALSQRGEHARALALSEKLVLTFPANTVLAQLHAGLLQRAKSKATPSAPASDDAAAQAGKAGRPYLDLMRLIEANQFHAALTVIEDLIAKGNTAKTLFMLGAKCALALKDEEKAKQFYEKVIEHYPDSIQPRLQLAELLDSRGENIEALHSYDALQVLAPDNLHVQHLRRKLIEKLSDKTADGRKGTVKLLPLPTNRFAGKSKSGNSGYGRGTFWRVIWNLALRQIRLRYPRTPFAIVLILFEPIAYVIVLWLALEFLFQRGRPPIGEHWAFFYATGIIPYLMFVHLATLGARGQVPFKALLEVPIIKPISVLMAAALAEFLVTGAAAALLFTGFYVLGVFAHVNDIYGVLSAFAATAALGTAFLLLNFGISSFLPSWQTAWMLIQRMLFFTSGIFMVAQSVPKQFRDYLVWNPLLICIEWFRHGFYTKYDPPWLDRSYLLFAIGISLVLGIILQSAADKRRAD